MRRRLVTAAATLLAIGVVVIAEAAAKQGSRFYTDARLSEWAPKYEENVKYNFNVPIAENLTSVERQTLRRVRLQFPLRSGLADYQSPLAFYALGDDIYLPVSSLRFLQDLSVALAYQSLQNRPVGPVYDYLLMIRYRDPADFGLADFQPPLQTFGIPESVKNSKDIWQFGGRIFTNAVNWLLCHELAHVHFSHRHYDYKSVEQALADENQADEFATDVLRRMGNAPVGAVPLLMALAHLDVLKSDFPDDKAWHQYMAKHATHPMAAERLTAMSGHLRTWSSYLAGYGAEQRHWKKGLEDSADQLRQLARKLDRRDIQVGLWLKGHSTTPTSLQAAVSGGGKGVSGRVFSSVKEFHGIYKGEYVRALKDGGEESLGAAVILDRRGNRVNGKLNFGFGDMDLQGWIEGDEVLVEWHWAGITGLGRFRLKGLSLAGTWGYQASKRNGGRWSFDPEISK